MDQKPKLRSEMTREELVADVYRCMVEGKNARLKDHMHFDPKLALAKAEHPGHGLQPMLNIWVLQAGTDKPHFDAGFVLMEVISRALRVPIDTIRDDSGKGPMDYAAQGGHIAYVNKLQHYGASLPGVTGGAAKIEGNQEGASQLGALKKPDRQV